MAINAFSNFTITLSDGGTVPSIGYLSNKTYVNIGSGNVLKVSWNTPTAANNTVDSYKIYILKYDFISASYKSLYTSNIGNVNEFYLKSSLFDSVPQSFVPLHVYVEAISKYGTAYNCISNIEAVDVSKGCGAYTRVKDGYAQPIMKRTLAFTKLDYLALTTEDGTTVTGSDGNILYTKVSSVQDDTTGWTLLQEFYSKGPQKVALRDVDGTALMDSNEKALYALAAAWEQSDLQYEILLDANGEIVTDLNDDQVYVL